MNIDKEFKEKATAAAQSGVGYAFCPKHLPKDEYGDLWVFPFNILFMKYRGDDDGSTTMGHALYLPQFDSLEQNHEQWTMRYANAYGGDDHVVITFIPAELAYRGDKYVGGKWIGSATGRIDRDTKNADEGWALFFYHLTMLGLSNGERCAFKKV